MPEIKTGVPAQATAGTAQRRVIDTVTHAATVTAASLVPEAAVTGNASNYRTFRLINAGQSGSGTTVIASFSTNATPANDLVADDEKAMTLSGTAANLNVADGDVLVVDEITVGTGVAHSGYVVRVLYS